MNNETVFFFQYVSQVRACILIQISELNHYLECFIKNPLI